MYYYSGYTIPLNEMEVFTLLEFGQYKRGEIQLYKHEFILHSYQTGEIQYEYMIENTVYVFLEDQLKSARACPSGSFKDNNGDILYHLSDDEVYSLQTSGLTKLWEADDEDVVIRIKEFKKYNLGGNYRYVAYVGDILVYFYNSDRTDIDCPY